MKNLDELLTKIDELDKKATPGPWSRSPFDGRIEFPEEPKKDPFEDATQWANDIEFACQSRTLLPKCGEIIKLFMNNELSKAKYGVDNSFLFLEIQKILEE